MDTGNETSWHAWETAFNHAASIMIEAAENAAAESSAWWIASPPDPYFR
jgi:hypothetical protein